MEKSEIKKCPICGNRKTLLLVSCEDLECDSEKCKDCNDRTYAVCCAADSEGNGCGMTGRFMASEESAIRWWNDIERKNDDRKYSREDLIAALEVCAENGDCSECPFYDLYEEDGCLSGLTEAVIHELKKGNGAPDLVCVLERCDTVGRCESCSYNGIGDDCILALLKDALLALKGGEAE